MTKHRFGLLLVLLVIIVGVMDVYAGGVIEFNFLKYSGYCKVKNHTTSKSVLRFTFCLDKERKPKKIAPCYYGSVQRTYSQGSSNVTLSKLTNIKETWIMNVSRFQGKSFTFVANAEDADKSNNLTKHMITFATNMKPTVYPSQKAAKWLTKTLSNSPYQLTFKIRFYCEDNNCFNTTDHSSISKADETTTTQDSKSSPGKTGINGNSDKNVQTHSKPPANVTGGQQVTKNDTKTLSKPPATTTSSQQVTKNDTKTLSKPPATTTSNQQVTKNDTKTLSKPPATTTSSQQVTKINTKTPTESPATVNGGQQVTKSNTKTPSESPATVTGRQPESKSNIKAPSDAVVLLPVCLPLYLLVSSLVWCHTLLYA